MEFQEAISSARDSMTAKRVYADPQERNGVMVIPAAEVLGGAGGGGGEQPDGAGGGGSGFGLKARPVGAYVVRDDKVSWQPAFDLNRVILGCQLLGLAAIVLTHLRLTRSGRRRRGRR
jgi:uncharacterized spore protein YtfJ